MIIVSLEAQKAVFNDHKQNYLSLGNAIYYAKIFDSFVNLSNIFLCDTILSYY